MGCLLPFSGGCSFPETQRAVTNALRRASAEARFSARAAAVQKGSVGCKRGFQISPTHFTFACADLLLDPARDSNFSFPPTQACTPGRSVDQERRIGPQVCGRSTSNSTSICVYGVFGLFDTVNALQLLYTGARKMQCPVCQSRCTHTHKAPAKKVNM